MTIPPRLPVLPSGEIPGARLKVIRFEVRGVRLPSREEMLRLVYGERIFDGDGDSYGRYEWTEMETVTRGSGPGRFLTIRLVAAGMPAINMTEDDEWFSAFTDEGEAFLIVQCSENWFVDWLATVVRGRKYDVDRGWVEPTPTNPVTERG